MPDLTARVTEILREHHVVPIEDRFLGRADLVRCGSSDCHWRGRDYEIAEHHAALIAQAAQEHYRPRVETARDLAEVERLRAEVALLRDGIPVRPLTEAESDLMTQVLDLRRERAEALAEIERLRGALDRVQALSNRLRADSESELITSKAVFRAFADEIDTALRDDQ